MKKRHGTCKVPGLPTIPGPSIRDSHLPGTWKQKFSGSLVKCCGQVQLQCLQALMRAACGPRWRRWRPMAWRFQDSFVRLPGANALSLWHFRPSSSTLVFTGGDGMIPMFVMFWNVHVQNRLPNDCWDKQCFLERICFSQTERYMIYAVSN